MSRDVQPIRYGRIDCMGSIEKAIEHTRFMLFRPFDLNKWISLGVIIFLALLGSGGGGLSFPNFQGPGGAPGAPPQSPQEVLDRVRDFVSENLTAIIVYASIGAVIVLALTVLVVWLGARGRLMFVRAVALNDHRIGANWTDAGRLSSSLFWFSFLVALAAWLFMLAVFALAAFLAVQAIDAGATSFEDIFRQMLVPILLFLVYIAIILPVWLLLNDFVVPVMFAFQLSIGPAWRIVLGMIGGNMLTLTLFYIIRFVVGIVKGIAIFIAGCATCCVGFVPVVSQALTAPVHVFDRAFSLYALQTAIPDIQIIQPIAWSEDPFESGSSNLQGY